MNQPTAGKRRNCARAFRPESFITDSRILDYGFLMLLDAASPSYGICYPQSSSRVSRHLEWCVLHVPTLQRVARIVSVADAALLAAANDAPRQIPGRPAPAIWSCSAAPGRQSRARHNLGSRGFGRRGGGLKGSHNRAARELSISSRADFNDHKHRPE